MQTEVEVQQNLRYNWNYDGPKQCWKTLGLIRSELLRKQVSIPSTVSDVNDYSMISNEDWSDWDEEDNLVKDSEETFTLNKKVIQEPVRDSLDMETSPPWNQYRIMSDHERRTSTPRRASLVGSPALF